MSNVNINSSAVVPVSCVEESNNSADDDIIIRNLIAVGMHPKNLPEHEGLQRASILIPLFQRECCTNNVRKTTSNEQDYHIGSTSAVVHNTIGEGNLLNSNKNNNQFDWHILFTQRPMHLKSHPGEVCFPGGRQDPEDESDDIRTAIREAYEEVGLKSDELRILCRLETVESYNGLCVTPIVALVNPGEQAEPHNLQLSQDEVESAFAVPLDYFSIEENCASVEDVQWRNRTFQLRTYHYQDNKRAGNVESSVGRTYRIWGLTAYVAHQVAQIALKDYQVAANLGSLMASKIKSPTIVQGTLMRLEGGNGYTKPYWTQKFFVLNGSILHQYDSESQASQKEFAATKKNRLPLINSEVKVKGRDDITMNHSGQFEFVVCVLNGRKQWRLGAPTLEERAKWLLAISDTSISEGTSST